MSHIVADPCIKCKYTDCVAVCPVDCFHEGMNMLVIDPETCIDCGLCPPECPVSAIFAEEDLPEKWAEFVQLNSKYSPLWPVIDSQKEPLPTAEEFSKVVGKTTMIDPNPWNG